MGSESGAWEREGDKGGLKQEDWEYKAFRYNSGDVWKTHKEWENGKLCTGGPEAEGRT